MVNIKVLFVFLREIFRHHKHSIIGIWCLDLISSIIVACSPLIIALTIDDLLNKSFRWFIYLLLIEIVYWIVHTANQYFDTRVYTKILQIKCEEYYNSALLSKTDESTIVARTNLIEDFTGFLEVELPNMIGTVFSIVVSLIYLCFESTPIIVLLAIIVSFVVIILACSWQRKIIGIRKKRKDENENELRIIKTKSREKYGTFLKSIFMHDIMSSDIEAKSFFINYFLQTVLLICAILSLFILDNLQAGVIFATITYVLELNSGIRNVPDHYFTILDLIDSANRVITHKKQDVSEVF